MWAPAGARSTIVALPLPSANVVWDGLCPVSPLPAGNTVCNLAPAPPAAHQPAHQPASFSPDRFRALSRLPTAVPDTALLAQHFDRFLGLRDVFCIREFLSGWWVLGGADAGAPNRLPN